MADLIAVDNLCKTYGSTEVLKNVSLRLQPGERIALMGQSGSGKTTLLNLLGLMDTPTSGYIAIRGQSVSQFSDAERTRIRQQQLGFVFQFFHLLPTLTVAENVALSYRLGGNAWSLEDKHRLNQLLSDLSIGNVADKFPGMLSGGQLQRAAIARALFHRPILVLADEPTGNLDSATSEEVLTVLEDSCRQTGTALVMVTHSQHACRIAQRVLHMQDGRLAMPVG